MLVTANLTTRREAGLASGKMTAERPNVFVGHLAGDA
jgi:hypothetical protein